MRRVILGRMKQIRHPFSSAGCCDRFWQPRLSLASCTRGVLGRSTLGARLTDAQRYSFFPATPACSLSWFFSGQGELIEPGYGAAPDSPRRPLPGRLVFNGPSQHPVTTWNAGEVHAMILVLLPDAFHAMTGIDPSVYLNRLVAAHEVFDAEWLAFCESLFAVNDDAQRVRLIAEFLEPRWQRARPEGLLPIKLYADWSSALAMRAATSGLGRSLRQADRRIKRWTGQPYRQLHALGRSELAFLDTMDAIQQGKPNWSDIAGQAGFSDQSHLCRQTRQVTGFSPEELKRGIIEDECFWAYRLWGLGNSKTS